MFFIEEKKWGERRGKEEGSEKEMRGKRGGRRLNREFQCIKQNHTV